MIRSFFARLSKAAGLSHEIFAIDVLIYSYLDRENPVRAVANVARGHFLYKVADEAWRELAIKALANHGLSAPEYTSLIVTKDRGILKTPDGREVEISDVLKAELCQHHESAFAPRIGRINARCLRRHWVQVALPTPSRHEQLAALRKQAAGISGLKLMPRSCAS